MSVRYENEYRQASANERLRNSLRRRMTTMDKGTEDRIREIINKNKKEKDHARG